MNRATGSMAVVVAPAVDLSGSAEFDPVRFADIMAAELSYAEGISVLPVNRALAVLKAQGRSNVESASHAMEVAGLVGADGILVFAVTDYDPYDPPRIGISAELYARTSGMGDGMSTAEFPAGVDHADSGPAPGGGFVLRTARVFDASHESVATGVREFAEQRGAEGSPYGWRKYLVSQQHYMRFCCYSTIRALLGDEESSMDQSPPEQEERTP